MKVIILQLSFVVVVVNEYGGGADEGCALGSLCKLPGVSECLLSAC